jgi:hypothetical protein
MAMRTLRGLPFLLPILAAGATHPTQAQTGEDRLNLTAFAVNMSNIGGGRAGVVEIQITSWSSPEERVHLITTMLEKGTRALLDELQKTPSHGLFRIPGLTGPDPHQLRMGNPLHYAWQTREPDGSRRIVIATDRYIGFEEIQAQPRTLDYPFTLFEIHLNAKGEGEGKMAVATKISFDKKKNVVELENYSSEPVRLQQIKIVK